MVRAITTGLILFNPSLLMRTVDHGEREAEFTELTAKGKAVKAELNVKSSQRELTLQRHRPPVRKESYL